MSLYNVQYYACITISSDFGCYFGLPAANSITCSFPDHGLPNILLQLWWSAILATAEPLYLPLQQQKGAHKDHHTWKADSLVVIINCSSRRKRHTTDINPETKLYRFSLI